MSINFYEILLPLAMILALAKVLDIFCRKINIPQVVSMLLAGVIIGLFNLIPGLNLVSASGKEGLGFLSKIGVILIMYSAGLETDVKQIKACGVASIVITIMGVVVPMFLGFLVATLFNGGFGALSNHQTFMSNLFYGTILTATSVSVSVATLKETGKLNTRVGTSIVSAAILDDILGIVVLSFVSSMSGSSSNGSGLLADALTSAMGQNLASVAVIISVLVYFIAIIVIGLLIRKLFVWLNNKYDHTRRIPIFGIAICFLFAFCSESVFGVADITGAYFAGLLLSGSKDTGYIDHRSEILSYMIFTPVFFANIGLNVDFSSISANMVWFGVCFILVGLIGKIIGCGTGALMCKYNLRDSTRVGLGMMARAEVCLICAQKGVDSGLVDSGILPFILILIIISSFVTPLLLKISYKKEDSKQIEPIVIPTPNTIPPSNNTTSK